MTDQARAQAAKDKETAYFIVRDWYAQGGPTDLKKRASLVDAIEKAIRDARVLEYERGLADGRRSMSVTQRS